jgi:hypothetical protein
MPEREISVREAFFLSIFFPLDASSLDSRPFVGFGKANVEGAPATNGEEGAREKGRVAEALVTDSKREGRGTLQDRFPPQRGSTRKEWVNARLEGEREGGREGGRRRGKERRLHVGVKASVLHGEHPGILLRVVVVGVPPPWRGHEGASWRRGKVKAGRGIMGEGH